MPVVEFTTEQLERIPLIIEEFVPHDWLQVEVSLLCKAEEALDGFQTQMFRRRGIEYKHTCDRATCEVWFESSTDDESSLPGVRCSCDGIVHESLPAYISG